MLARHSIPTRSWEVSQIRNINSDTDIVWLGLEYLLMADKAQEFQVGDFNIGSGWETFMANYSRAIVTDVEGFSHSSTCSKTFTGFS